MDFGLIAVTRGVWNLSNLCFSPSYWTSYSQKGDYSSEFVGAEVDDNASTQLELSSSHPGGFACDICVFRRQARLDGMEM